MYLKKKIFGCNKYYDIIININAFLKIKMYRFVIKQGINLKIKCF